MNHSFYTRYAPDYDKGSIGNLHASYKRWNLVGSALKVLSTELIVLLKLWIQNIPF